MIEIDQITGEARPVIRTVRSAKAVSSSTLPPEPTTVDIHLHRHGQGATTVQLDHRNLPAELAETVQPFWEWALRELHNRLSQAPFHGYPWDR
jgi:YbbR domain-containing protein